MKKFSFTTLIIIIGLILMSGFVSANVFNASKEESNQSKKETTPVNPQTNQSYNYTQTYFTSNNRQHKFITTYLELTNTKGEVIGVAGLVQMGKQVIVKLNVSGLKPGKHGFHIHEKPITNNDFSTAGGHFNPTEKQHGHDNSNGAHLGDLPNLVADKDGKIDTAIVLEGLSLEQGEVSNSILGKSLIIHEKEDDGKTDPSGNSGDRVAGGNIPQ